MVRVDAFSIFFHVLVTLMPRWSVLASFEYLDVQRIRTGEYYALILFGAVGMVLMSAAVELVMIFIALEISSISTYILAGFRRRSPKRRIIAQVFLAGLVRHRVLPVRHRADVRRHRHHQHLSASRTRYAAASLSTLVYLAVALMFVGIGFKVAAAPFHVWTPDVYEGAPAPGSGIHVHRTESRGIRRFAARPVRCRRPRLVLADLDLGGAVDDARQHRRARAAEHQAHAGLHLHRARGIHAGCVRGAPRKSASPPRCSTPRPTHAMNVGAFAVVSHFANTGERYVSSTTTPGSAAARRMLAAMLTIFLLSLIGIPITGGFFAKFYVFNAALKANLVWLTIIGVVNSAIAAYYYLRVIVVMYMREPKTNDAVPRIHPALGIALAVSVLATIYLGVLPESVLAFARKSAHDLLR